MTTTTKFKAGDKVRFKGTPHDQQYRSWFWPLSTNESIFTVESAGTSGVDCLYFGACYGDAYNVGAFASRFELFTDPKALKVGDVVRFKDTPEDQNVRRMFDPSSTKDATFTITGFSPFGSVRLDGESSGYFRTRFDLVKAAPEPAIKGFRANTIILDEVPPAPKKGVPLQSHIVIQKNSKGHLKPANTPFVHTTKAAAEKEASRLAKEHPGQTFVVFSSVNEASAPAPLVTVTKHAAA